MRNRINKGALIALIVTLPFVFGSCSEMVDKKHNLTEREQAYVNILTDGPLTRREKLFVGVVSPRLYRRNRLSIEEAVEVSIGIIEREYEIGGELYIKE